MAEKKEKRQVLNERLPYVGKLCSTRYHWQSTLSTYRTNGRGGHQIDEKRFATRHRYIVAC